jgi:hypothetical protein
MIVREPAAAHLSVVVDVAFYRERDVFFAAVKRLRSRSSSARLLLGRVLAASAVRGASSRAGSSLEWRLEEA